MNASPLLPFDPNPVKFGFSGELFKLVSRKLRNVRRVLPFVPAKGNLQFLAASQFSP